MADGENPIKVMSWNIHGPGRARVRNDLIPVAATRINPDVMLLQNTRTNLLVDIFDTVLVENFAEVEAGRRRESRILYNTERFEAIPNENFPGREGNENIQLNRILELCIEDVQGGNEQQTLRMRNLFWDRISIVCLRRRQQRARRHQPRGPPIIFMSFHNVYNTPNISRIAMRDAFIAMVTAVHELTECTVVAGADLKQHIDNPEHPVLRYVPTPRRRQQKQVDYILQDPAPPAHNVTAWDFINYIRNQRHIVMDELFGHAGLERRQRRRRKNRRKQRRKRHRRRKRRGRRTKQEIKERLQRVIRECESAVYHDPLVLEC